MAHNISKALKSLRSSLVTKPSSLRLPPLPSPRDLIRLYKLQARKHLAQNFLLDSRLTSKIAKSAGRISNGDVCEVGPGPGSITRSILKRRPGRLLVIEKDDRFLPFLEMLREASEGRMHIILGDVLLFDMSKMFREELRKPWDDQCPNIHVIGNLPFNVSTPLIVRWLRDICAKQNAWAYGRVKMTLTFQKEVAERIVAPANHPQRCRLSVMCQNWCDVNHTFTIAGSAFVPPPDVDVGVVTFEPKVKAIIDDDFLLVEKVVRQIFSSRQKYCIKCVQTLFPKHIAEELSVELLRLADVKQTTRSYQITNEEFHRIVLAFRHICDKHPKLYKFNPAGKQDEMFWLAAEEDKQSDVEVETDTIISYKSASHRDSQQHS